MTAGEKEELAAWIHNRLSWYEPLDDMREQLPYEALPKIYPVEVTPDE